MITRTPYEMALRYAIEISMHLDTTVSVIPKFGNHQTQESNFCQVGCFDVESGGVIFAELFVDAQNGTIFCKVLM